MRISLFNASLFLGLCVICPGPLYGQDPKEEAMQKDRKLIQGTWKVTRLVDSGKVAHDHDLQKVVVINGDDGSWMLVADGKEIAKGPSTFDPTGKPKTLDFHLVKDDGGKEFFLGIYELGATQRKMCFKHKAKGRPKGFESTKEGGEILVEFERDKGK